MSNVERRDLYTIYCMTQTAYAIDVTCDSDKQKLCHLKSALKSNNRPSITCRQSRAVTTIRGHLDWQASSNGRKYLSASINGCLPLGGGRADEGLSSLLNKTQQTL